MTEFGGFKQKERLIKLPESFLAELLPQIDNLPELKITLYCFWLIQRDNNKSPYLRENDVMADTLFLAGSSSGEAEASVREGLERAVARGTLVRVIDPARGVDEAQTRTDVLYFVNTPRGRAMAKGLASGKWQPDSGDEWLLSARRERPNIYGLYEQNIGPLTPIIAEKLKDCEKTYGGEWVREAIELAVNRNKRSLAYIEGILKRWQADGRDNADQIAKGGRRFISGKLRDEINY